MGPWGSQSRSDPSSFSVERDVLSKIPEGREQARVSWLFASHRGGPARGGNDGPRAFWRASPVLSMWTLQAGHPEVGRGVNRATMETKRHVLNGSGGNNLLKIFFFKSEVQGDVVDLRGGCEGIAVLCETLMCLCN